jgi:hypothetical protein
MSSQCPTPPWPLSFPDVLTVTGIWARPPALLAVNHMFRQECLRFYQQPVMLVKDFNILNACIHFSPDFDSLLVPKALLNLNRTFTILGLEKAKRLIVLCTPEDAIQASRSRQIRRDSMRRISALHNVRSMRYGFGYALDQKGDWNGRAGEVELITKMDRASESAYTTEFWRLCGPMYVTS